MKRTSGNAVAIVIPVVVIVIIGVLLAVFWNRIYDTSQKNSVGSSSPDQQVAPQKEQQADDLPLKAEKGSISGNIRYPIEFLSNQDRDKGMTFPADMRICAIDSVTNDEEACTDTLTGLEESYSLKVSPGTYLIRATTGHDVAYYDPYVSANDSGYWPMDGCSVDASTPIELNVSPGEDLTQIDAADFWVGHLGCEDR